VERVAPPGGYSRGLAEPAARSVQQTCDQGRPVTFTWFDPPFRPEPPHANQAYGICFTGAGMIVLGGCDTDGGRYLNLLGGGVEPGESLEGRHHPRGRAQGRGPARAALTVVSARASWPRPGR
jgi:hypothetical protein